MLRAAIAGLGWWGKTLVTSVHRKSKDITFTAGATGTRAKAEEFSREHGIRLVDDYDQLLADPEIDAVVLATPHSRHGDQVRQAAAVGKHVFCEKPFTLKAADAATSLDTPRKSAIVLAVGFNRRFHPSSAALKRRVKVGKIAAIKTCFSEHTA